MSMMDKLKELVGKSPDKTKQAIDKATSFANEKTGGKHSDQLEQAEEKAHDYIDRHSEQGDQDPSDQGQAGHEQGGGQRQ